MNRYSYVPFAGGLADLKGPELGALREVSAGWYVEYLASLVPAVELAKHLSAFANQSGGWLFIGIREGRSGSKAVAFPGLPMETVEDAQARLCEAASVHVTPEIFFEHRVIQGPISELDLPVGQAIIVAGIPQGPNPPFIHCSGGIYRRAPNQGTPAPETDRQVLDLLWNRGREAQQRLAAFLSPAAAGSNGSDQRVVEAAVYFFSDPFLEGSALDLPFEDFRRIMRQKGTDDIISAGFQDVFTTADGYVAQRTAGLGLMMGDLTFRWWLDGNARISFPVETTATSSFPLFSDPQRIDFVRMLRGRGLAKARIADFSQFVGALSIAAAKYLRLREAAGMRGPFWGKLRFSQARGVVPFLNLRRYLETAKDCGFPVLQDDDFYAPPGLSAADLIKLDSGKWTQSNLRGLFVALQAAMAALPSVGMGLDNFIKEDPDRFWLDLAESVGIRLSGPLRVE